MKAVLRSILRARQRHQSLPLYDFMRDDSIPARSRLAFYPCLSLFVMALDDLSKYVMRDERSNEKYQLLVNAHAWEGGSRWQWYLEDLARLGFDQHSCTSSVLRSIFSEENRVGRLLGAKLAHVVYGAAPIERLVIIEAIEAAGGTLFRLAAGLAEDVRNECNVGQGHLSDFDFSRRVCYGVGESRTTSLDEIHLDADGRLRCMAQVERVFDLFEEWTDELLAFAVTQEGGEYNGEMAIDDGLAPAERSVLRFDTRMEP